MGEIIYKELVAIKTGNMWFYTMDRSITNNQFVTIEEIRTIINQEYSSFNVTIDERDNEIYILSENPIPCKNCDN
jgi:hypothetical protein